MRGFGRFVATLVLAVSLAACGTLQTRKPSATAAVDPNGGRSPAFSPDGARIAFLSSSPHAPPDLWVMSADGSGKRRLTTRGVSRFRWSSDGQSILAVARRKGYEEVLSIDLQKPGREERVPGLPPNAGLPVFNPDGSLFAFTTVNAEGVRDLWVGTADRSRIEAVTENFNIRSFFWGASRKLYYEAGKTYGMGLWELDLSIMKLTPVFAKYIGTPEYLAKTGLVAYPYPTNAGEFSVQTTTLDGATTRTYKAPRLRQKSLAWAPDGTGLYYVGQDLAAPAPPPAAETPPPADAAAAAPEAAPPHGGVKGGEAPKGAASLWRLDLESGTEQRLTSEQLHISEFALSPDGKTAVVTGVLPESRGPELFRVDLATREAARLTTSRASQWMPVPSPDATRVAYATNEDALDAVRVADAGGKEIAAYPGFILEADARLFWLPRSNGLLVFSSRGVHAFSEEHGSLAFPDAKELRAFLYADASIQGDRVALTAIPRYGETPGLYVIEAVDGKFELIDLRSSSAAHRYLQPRWSLDGERIAFTDGVDVWTMNADGESARRVTAYAEANAEAKEREVAASFPVWSVGGRQLAYTLTVYDGASVRREIWVIDADGTAPRQLLSEEVDSQLQVFLPEYTTQPFFDHADRRLIVTAVAGGLPNVVAIDVATGTAKALTQGGAVFPAMLPEEDAIVYTSLDGNDERIWVMNADGTGKRPFLKPAEAKPAGEKAAGLKAVAGEAAEANVATGDAGAAAGAGRTTSEPAAPSR